jgi:hypothetical protein
MHYTYSMNFTKRVNNFLASDLGFLLPFSAIIATPVVAIIIERF